MQTLSWYLRRLRAMSPDEIAWRARSSVRDVTDRYRIALKAYPHTEGQPRRVSSAADAPRWCGVPRGHWSKLATDDPAAGWRDRLVDRADRIADHRLSFFDLEEVALGDPIDWNREYALNRPTPLGFSPSIDYRDLSVTGDAKVAWEPNRHHQFVVLGRAYRATGNVRYAAAIVEQIDSWIDQCPFGYGMSWRSPLELAIRIINWTWAIDLIADSGVITPEFDARLLQTVTLHVWDIARKYSRGSSANNHRIGEACGVFVATSYFPEIPDASRLRAESHEIIAGEITEQTYPSGATREQAFGYHLFVLHLFVVAGVVGRQTDLDFSLEYWSRLDRMFSFAGALAEGGPLPMVGDADDAFVLDLGDAPSDVARLMQLRATLFNRSTHDQDEPSEAAYWLFFPADRPRRSTPTAPVVPGTLESVAFEDAGYYLLQCGHVRSRDRISVVFDCGELGFGSIAAHGHADALSVVVRAGGADLLVDPGTYDYFSFPEWRQYFRSTPAHNTVTMDGVDQSAQLGSFLWGRRAAARCVDWRPSGEGGSVMGEHDGYLALPDPVTCRRTIDLDAPSRTVTITDDIGSAGPHRVDLYFHLAEHCDARADGNRVLIESDGCRAVLTLDARLDVAMSKGGDASGGGWVSRGYHRRSPAWVVKGTLQSSGALRLQTRVEIVVPT